MRARSACHLREGVIFRFTPGPTRPGPTRPSPERRICVISAGLLREWAIAPVSCLRHFRPDPAIDSASCLRHFRCKIRACLPYSLPPASFASTEYSYSLFFFTLFFFLFFSTSLCLSLYLLEFFFFIRFSYMNPVENDNVRETEKSQQETLTRRPCRCVIEPKENEHVSPSSSSFSFAPKVR